MTFLDYINGWVKRGRKTEKLKPFLGGEEDEKTLRANVSRQWAIIEVGGFTGKIERDTQKQQLLRKKKENQYLSSEILFILFENPFCLVDLIYRDT